MEFKNIPNPSIFKQYLWSYLTVFLIPLAIFLTVVNIAYIHTIQEEISTTNRNVIDQASMQIDEQIYEVSNIGNQINQSRQFSTYSLTSGNSLENAIDFLKVHATSSRSINNIYVVLNESERVISSKGTMSLNGLLSANNNFDVIERKQLHNNILSPTEKLSVYTLEQYINPVINNKVAHYTVPLEGPTSDYGSIIFVLNMTPSSTILRNLENSENDRIGFVIDSDNEFIYGTEGVEEINQPNLLSVIPEEIENGITDVEYEDYTLTSIPNHITGWTIGTMVKTNQLYQPFYKALFFFLISFIIMIILGFLVSFYFSFKSYNPVKKLLNTFSIDNEKKINNEWSYIQYNVSRTQAEHKLLDELIDEHSPIIRNTTLLNLIEGKNYDNSDAILSKLREIDISFPFPFYTIMAVEFGEDNLKLKNTINTEKLIQNLSEIKQEEFTLEATIPYLDNNQILIIANIKERSKYILGNIVSIINDEIENNFLSKKQKMLITIGNTYKTLDEIKNSYIEASYTLETINLTGSKFENPVFFKEVSHQNEKDQAHQVIQYPETDISLLIQSIKKGNERTALETLDNIFEDLNDGNQHNITSQAIASEVFNSIFKIATKYNLNKITNKHNHIKPLSDFTNLSRLKNVLSDIVKSICKYIQEQRHIEKTQIGKNIVNYIESNYDSAEISLESIASNNGISLSYASKLIKEEAGKSFSNILQDLRMERFKDLLVESNKPIKNLVREIGYYDVSNFTRKFRKENEITPGKYRKKYKK